jgi:flagellar basal-body rod modification protein FlgD
MSTPVSGVNTPTAADGTNNSSGSSSNATSGVDKLANEQTFLQLLVSQLQNQDPLNPADGTQFVTQLAQFSQLEQMLNISGDVSAIRQQIAPSSSTSTPASGS